MPVITAHSFATMPSACVVYAVICVQAIGRDGAVWIWNLILHYFPNAIQIVDWYHAEDRLKRIAEAVFSSPSQRQVWLAQVVESLWQGQVEEVILACQR